MDWIADVCSSDLGVHVWRLHPARPPEGQGHHRAGRLRGGRRALGRQDERRGAARGGMRGLSLGRLLDRKSVVSGKSVSVRVDLGGRRIIKKNKTIHLQHSSKVQSHATSITI